MVGKISELTNLTDVDDDLDEFEVRDQSDTPNNDVQNKVWELAVLKGILTVKTPVRVATTVNGTLATAYENGDTVDGIVLATGNRILLKNQTTAAENGIYTVNASGAPTRTKDFNTSAKVKGGMIIPVQEGTINKAIVWKLTNTGTITIDTTELTFESLVSRSRIRTSTASETLAEDDEIVLVNPSTSAMTLTLPAASNRAGKYYKLIYISTTGQPVIIDGNASETINGKTTVLIEHKYSQWEIYCDGSNWFGNYTDSTIPNIQQVILTDDFIGGVPVTNGDCGDLNWLRAGVGTETGVVLSSGVNQAGNFRLGTSSSLGDDSDMFLYGSNSLNFIDFGGDWSFTWIISISGTLADATRRYGLFRNTTSNSEEVDNNACILFDTAVSAKWRYRTRSNAGTDQTTTDAGTDVALATVYKFKCVRDGSTIRFYKDDVNVANHSTQVPSLGGCPGMTVDATSAFARTQDVDYFQLRFLMSR